MSSIIDVPSSDDDIPGPSGLKIVAGRKRAAPSTTNNNTSTQSTNSNFPTSSTVNQNNAVGGISKGTIVSPVGSQQGSTTAAVGNKKKAKVVTHQQTTTHQQLPSKAFCLIWVCTHGKGRNRRSWRNKDLKIMGVYPSKADAENAKRRVMSQYDCCGHGDILVGGTWEDEIDLVIREAPLNL